jgi:hypothetical protein
MFEVLIEVVVAKIMLVATIAKNERAKLIESFAQVMLFVLLGAVFIRLNSAPSLVIAVALIVFEAVSNISPIAMLIVMIKMLPSDDVLIASKN